MKKIFISSGETAVYTNLHTDRIIVKGILRVNGKLEAKEILGGGIIEAREIVCDDLRASTVASDFLTARRITAEKLFVQFECRAQVIAVRDYATAGYVNVGKLSVTLSDIHTCDADEIITLKRKNSLLGLLWAYWWHGLFLNLFYGGEKKTKPEGKNAEDKPVAEGSMPVPVEAARVQTVPAPTNDATIDMMIAILTELRKQGYKVSKADDVPVGEEAAA